MLSALVLSGALALGQPPQPSEPPTPPKNNNASAESPCEPQEETPTPDKWLLMRSLEGTRLGDRLEHHKISILGWTEGAFTASSNNGNQLPMGFNYRANEFLLQQNWLRIERPIDEKASTATWGFRSDNIVPGTDYRFTIARGLFDNQLTKSRGGPNLYGFDPVQFYGEAYLPNVGSGLDVKLGRFFAQFGVESIDTTLNPFVSRSYTFIYNPFTHTGLLTTLKLDDTWSVQNGIVTGSDVFIDPAANPTYLGSVKWAPPEGDSTALFCVIVGNGRFDTKRSFHNPQIFDLVLTRKLSDKMTWSFEGLYGFTTRFPASGFANWFGVVNYLNYQFSEKWIGNTRLEFFSDPQAQRTGFDGTYTAITAGVTYKPLPGLWFRPEARFDHNDSRPFEGKPSVFTAAFDVVVRW